MIDLRCIYPSMISIDLNHVKSKISVPFVFENPIRAGT